MAARPLVGGATSAGRGEKAHATLQNSMKNLTKMMEQANAAFEEEKGRKASPPRPSPLKALSEDKGLSSGGGASFDAPERPEPLALSSEEEDSASDSDGSSSEDNDVAAGRYVEPVEEEEVKHAKERPPKPEELMAAHKVVIETPDFFNEKSSFEMEIEQLGKLQEQAGKIRGNSVREMLSKPKSLGASKSPPKSSPLKEVSPQTLAGSPNTKQDVKQLLNSKLTSPAPRKSGHL